MQQIAEAISSVLKLEVTIVDRHLVRVAGTGRYKQGPHQLVPTSSSFERQLQTGEPMVIENAGVGPSCVGCAQAHSCPERAHIAYPIKVSGETTGVIGLVAFDEVQRQKLINKSAHYMEFLGRMAELVASKILEDRATQAVEEANERVRGIVESIHEGILAIDGNGVVILCNSSASALPALRGKRALGRKLAEVLPDLPLLRVVESGEGFINREISLPATPGTAQHVVVTATPLMSHNHVVGAVALMKDMHEVKSIVNAISAGHPAVSFATIVGKAPGLLLAKENGLRAAAGNATVLIRGESGTGKELFARAIHSAGKRSAGPFLAVNCAAIPEDLLESEFFGYEEGAFTGAKRGGKPGKFELADGGTLFLDEIGDMALGLQAKLLRALDGSQVERVGGTRSTRINVRIVAATNRDLEAMVRAREFREDLFYRLNVIPIDVPPVRERPDDIPLLLDYFVSKHARALGRQEPGFSAEALDLLTRYPWPGNVRELANSVEFLLNVVVGPVITAAEIPERIRRQVKEPTLSGTLRDMEYMALEQALQRYGRHEKGKEEVARVLGVSRATLYRRIREFGL